MQHPTQHSQVTTESTATATTEPETAESPGSALAIEIDALHYAYRPGATAIENLSLKVGAGAFYGLLGRNGAGKSSLVNCMVGLLKPTGGSLTVLGRDPWRARRELMREIALVPEVPNVSPTQSAAKAAEFRSKFYGARFDRDFFDQLIEQGNVDPRKAIRNLSRGQKTQVTLALALASRPSLLILDDPTLGLDVVARTFLFQLLIEQQTQWDLTVVITTHDLAALDGLASHVGFLDRGLLVEQGSVEELKQRYRLVEQPLGQEPELYAGAHVVRAHPTTLGQQLLIKGDGNNTIPLGSVPTIEELFVALLQAPANVESPDSARAA